MRYQYVVTLKRESEKYVDRISFLLCSLSLLAFVFWQLRSGQLNFFLSFCVLLLGLGICLNTSLFRKGTEEGKRQVRYRNWLLIAGIGWLGMPWLQWICVLFLVLAFLEYQARYPLEIGFSPDQIVINSLFKKKLAWDSLQNVVLKDGLLTLDFKNNQLLQKEVLDDGEEDADEDEFNEYCRERLSLAALTSQNGA